MTPERGQRVYAVFEAALNCDPAGRAAMLDERCTGDPELRAEVERLLGQDTEAEKDRFLATPVSTGRDALRHDMSTEEEPGFDRSRSLEGSSAETPIPAAMLPPGLAEHPDYAIKRELGRGGMGLVYLAENRLMGRDEVLKVTRPKLTEGPEVLERCRREVRAVAKLDHPNIVTAYRAAQLGENILLALEYVNGRNLSQVVKARGPLPVADACNYVQQAALGLQHAHEQGLSKRSQAREASAPGAN